MSILDRFSRSTGKTRELSPEAAPPRPPASYLEDEIASLRLTNIELLETLGAVVDALNASTLNHSAQVALYSLMIARTMGMIDHVQQMIFKAALVHDLGMICMSSAAMARPSGLNQDEIEQMRLHPTIGGEIIARISNLSDLAPLVHYHHEWYDGTGYPDRLSGEEIPIGARIICLADSIDAMLSGRPGHKPKALPEVIAEVQRYSGTQFDPQVVQAFLTLAAQRGGSLFFSSTDPAQDMLLQTLGISTGRATQIINRKE